MEMLRSNVDTTVEQPDSHEEDEEEHFHVLAVDDSVFDRKLLERLLKVSSYKVTCVDSGDEALKYLGLAHDDDDDVDKNSSASSSNSSSSSPPSEGSKVNLIMTDYCMPGMSGYDLLKRLKESSWKNVPVVVMSSENVPSRINKCLEGGAEEFLLKPLQLSDLKKLSHYLLKPLIVDQSCESKITETDETLTKNDVVYDESDAKSDVSNGKSTGHNNASANAISKRKAVMSPSPSDRRPKAKGLAVI